MTLIQLPIAADASQRSTDAQPHSARPMVAPRSQRSPSAGTRMPAQAIAGLGRACGHTQSGGTLLG